MWGTTMLVRVIPFSEVPKASRPPCEARCTQPSSPSLTHAHLRETRRKSALEDKAQVRVLERNKLRVRAVVVVVDVLTGLSVEVFACAFLHQ